MTTSEDVPSFTAPGTWALDVDHEDDSPELVERRNMLADAARDARWDLVLRLLEHDRDWVNIPRPGSRSGYAPLHQAAWHGADRGVVERLLAIGAWRTLRTLEGDRPVDVARERGHDGLVDLLGIELPDADVTADIQSYLHTLMAVRTRHFVGERPLRLPPVELLLELPRGESLWCPVAGMYGGFDLRWEEGAVIAESWSRVSGGSGQRHRITKDGVELVEDGTC